MAGNDNGPWGSGGGKPGGGDKGSNNRDNNNNRGPDTPQMPEIDDLVKKGQEQLRVLMGGRGSGNGGGGGRTSGGGGGINRGTIGLGLLGLVIVWAFMSFYRVDTSEQSVELLFGEYHQTGNEGLNFAPWPFVTKEILPVTNEQTEDIGVGGQGRNRDQGFMLTGDENIDRGGRCNCLYIDARAQFYALFHHTLGNNVAGFIIKAAQHLITPIPQVGFNPQPVQNASKFTGNIPAPHDQYFLGQGRQVKNVVRCNRQFLARRVRHRGPTACGQQNGFRSHFAPIGQTHRVGPRDRGALVKGFNPGIGQQFAIYAL